MGEIAAIPPRAARDHSPAGCERVSFICDFGVHVMRSLQLYLNTNIPVNYLFSLTNLFLPISNVRYIMAFCT